LVELLIVDIDECREHPGICSYKCQNTEGDFDCICPPGQIRLADRKSCAGTYNTLFHG